VPTGFSGDPPPGPALVPDVLALQFVLAHPVHRRGELGDGVAEPGVLQAQVHVRTGPPQVQEERFLGNYQARWYRTVRAIGGTGELTDPATQFVESEVTRLNLKSVIARVRKAGDTNEVIGFVLNDGTPLRSVEVKVDDGAWQPATLDPANTKFSWKLFRYQWRNATPGDHTLVSRATDVNGVVQPTTAELSRKKTFLEDNAQFPRKVRIA